MNFEVLPPVTLKGSPPSLAAPQRVRRIEACIIYLFSESPYQKNKRTPFGAVITTPCSLTTSHRRRTSSMSSRRPNRARTSRSGEDGAIPRITPRNSDVEAADTAETPYGTLRQLANIPRPSTPLRRASSVGPPSIHRSSRRTPAAQARTPGAAHRYGGSGKKASVLTPHGRAAAREIEARRAGLTPGKDRRRSGRQQRETPRDALRLLSRALAPKTQPVVPTPQAEVPISRRNNLPPDDDLDEDELAPPRLSMALDNDEDDSLLLPPQSAGLEDDNFTVQSVEMGRRAISEQPGGRFSRGSFGSIRMSDQFGNLDMGMDGTMAGIDSSLVRDNAFEDSDAPDMTEIRSILGYDPTLYDLTHIDYETTGKVRRRCAI